MEFPQFRYHPDPLKTGSVRLSKQVCVVCSRRTGYIYTGPVYAEAELNEQICPWCIANGNAHAKYDAEFSDLAGVGGYHTWDAVPLEIAEHVAYRTPGFSGWQQERWFTHCGDAGAFLGVVGYDQLVQHGPAAVEAIASEAARHENGNLDQYVRALSATGQPTAYLFVCLHCGTYGGYSDFT